jgi:hypothetical protein
LIIGKSLEILIGSGPSLGDGRKMSKVNRLGLGGFAFVEGLEPLSVDESVLELGSAVFHPDHL